MLPFGMSSLPMGGPVVIERVWRPPSPLDVRLTLATLPGVGRWTAAEVEAFYEQWRPHRYRAFHRLELTPSAWPPRRGARMARPEHRHGW